MHIIAREEANRNTCNKAFSECEDDIDAALFCGSDHRALEIVTRWANEQRRKMFHHVPVPSLISTHSTSTPCFSKIFFSMARCQGKLKCSGTPPTRNFTTLPRPAAATCSISFFWCFHWRHRPRTLTLRSRKLRRKAILWLPRKEYLVAIRKELCAFWNENSRAEGVYRQRRWKIFGAKVAVIKYIIYLSYMSQDKSKS